MEQVLLWIMNPSSWWRPQKQRRCWGRKSWWQRQVGGRQAHTTINFKRQWQWRQQLWWGCRRQRWRLHWWRWRRWKKKGTSAHIPSVSVFATPGQWQDFIPFQSKGKIGPQNSQFQSITYWTPKQSIPEQHGLPNSQSMSNTKLKWPICIPTFCWAEMAI